jgi:hypothetical protein
VKRLSVSFGVVVGLVAAFFVGPMASAATTTATIHPGVQTYTNGAQCTANFVFTGGGRTFLGQAAHCSSTGSNTNTNGCTTQSLPLGTPVTILGASQPGTMVYNSWIAMRDAHEADPDACAYNDLALIEINPADVPAVSASVPHWGGPVGLNTGGTASGESVYSYGNSILRGGVTLLSPKVGTSSGDDGHGWTHIVSTVTPGIPGDSGSAFLDASGKALGDLSTIGVGVPDGVVNNVSDLNHELGYLRAHTNDAGLKIVQLSLGGTFDGTKVPLDTANPVDDPVGGLRNFFGI